MKRMLLLLNLSWITFLMANQENQIAKNENAYECSSSNSCKPKCCPTPPAPICTESYLPSYYDLQCNTGVFSYGDFLYWFANEDNLSPCMTVRGNGAVAELAPTTTLISTQRTLNLVKINQLDAKWDPGFRAGIGFCFNNNGWDLEANYTWYHNTKQHTFSVPGFGITFSPTLHQASALFPDYNQLALLDPWINTTIYDNIRFYGPFLFDKVSTTWNLRFNQIDLELGNKLWFRQFTALRFFAGVRGAWFKTTFNNTASNVAARAIQSPTTVTLFGNSHETTRFSDQFIDRLWGVGLLAGIQPEWHFWRNFIFFSNIDGALLWGTFKVRKIENYTSFGASGTETIDYHNVATNRLIKMQAVFDLTVGFRWEATWCYRVRTALDFGWENHLWFDDNHRFKTEGSYPRQLAPSRSDTTHANYNTLQSYEEEQGNLMMGGGFVSFRVDF